VNYDATVRLVRFAKDVGISRFIYASSSSVYGVKPDGVDVTEDLVLEPLTDYSTYKARGEGVVLMAQSQNFTTTVIRPATLCGYAPRLRLDLIVNILTSQAVKRGEIPIFGGEQRRPNLHIADMVRAYVTILEAEPTTVAGQVFNVGAENATVRQLAERVQTICGGELKVTETNDQRSYAVNSDRIKRVLGFTPDYLIDEAILDLRSALLDGRVPNAMTDPIYYNIKQMQTCHIS
jgi:nucleoside-diphosphate-sugar epimerase